MKHTSYLDSRSITLYNPPESNQWLHQGSCDQQIQAALTNNIIISYLRTTQLSLTVTAYPLIPQLRRDEGSGKVLGLYDDEDYMGEKF